MQACVPIFDKLFTRLGSEDAFEKNASTLMMEMRDLALILNNATERSLVIADELGRATAPEEGEAICWASCEELISRKCVTLVSTQRIPASFCCTILIEDFSGTHFHNMCLSLSDSFPGNVRNIQMAFERVDEKSALSLKITELEVAEILMRLCCRNSKLVHGSRWCSRYERNWA